MGGVELFGAIAGGLAGVVVIISVPSRWVWRIYRWTQTSDELGEDTASVLIEHLLDSGSPADQARARRLLLTLTKVQRREAA